LRTTAPTTENLTSQIVSVHENLSYLSKGSDTIFYFFDLNLLTFVFVITQSTNLSGVIL
jgi:hypothetical protein